MKTKITFSALLVILIIVLLGTSCEHDPIESTKKYTIEVSNNIGGTIIPSGTIEVNEGGSESFYLNPDPGFKPDSIKVNGIYIPLTDNKFSLSDVGENYKIAPVFNKTLSWYLIQKSWTEDSVFLKEDNGPWVSYTTKPWVNYYLPNGQIETYSYGELIGTGGSWSVTETADSAILNQDGQKLVIEKLDDKYLIVVGQSLYNVNPIVTVRVVYKHPN